MDRKRLIDTNFPTQDNYSLVKMRLNEKTCEKIVIGLGVVSSFALIIGLSVGLTVNKDEPETTSTTSTTYSTSESKPNVTKYITLKRTHNIMIDIIYCCEDYHVQSELILFFAQK